MAMATRKAATFLQVLCLQMAIFAAGGLFVVSAASYAKDDDDGGMVMKADTVAARLGGFPGIYAFVRDKAEPALLADVEIAAFFGNLSETPDDIAQCLAMLLDHDLGGSSPHNGAVLASGHECRSSMSNIHRGRNIPARIFDKFIAIIGQQAVLAGVAPADIQAVAKVLNRYKGGTINK